MSSTKRKAEEGEAAVAPKKSKSKLGVLDMVKVAIRHEKNHQGSSRQGILKHLKEMYSYENANAIKKGLNSGVEKGQLICENKTRYKVSGDPEYEIPASERVEIKVIQDAQDETMTCERGDIVWIDYIGYIDLGSGAKKRFETGSNFEFMVGAGDVIKGMDKGVLGAKLREVRDVYIPSQMGYGKKGSGEDLPPDSNLIFYIKIARIQKA